MRINCPIIVAVVGSIKYEITQPAPHPKYMNAKQSH